MLEELQIDGSEPLGTPGAEDVLESTPDEEAYGSEALGPATATQYRALTARASYTADDRANINFAVN